MITTIKDKSYLAPIVTGCRAAWKAGIGKPKQPYFSFLFFLQIGQKVTNYANQR
jgi:hypothetical protein